MMRIEGFEVCRSDADGKPPFLGGGIIVGENTKTTSLLIMKSNFILLRGPA